MRAGSNPASATAFFFKKKKEIDFNIQKLRYMADEIMPAEVAAKHADFKSVADAIAFAVEQGSKVCRIFNTTSKCVLDTLVQKGYTLDYPKDESCIITVRW